MTLRILLIDDEKSIRDEMAETIQSEIPGMAVDAYPSGEEALAVLRREPEAYLALITDWLLPPPLQGVDILHAARQINPRLFIIAFTGKVQGHGSEAIQKGADLYLYKPVDPAELVGVLKNLSEQDGAFTNIAQTAQTLMKSAQVLVWRYHEKRRELTLAAWSDPDSIAHEDRSIILSQQDNRRLRNILNKEEPVYIRSLRHPSCYHDQEFADRHAWQALVSVPMRCQGELIGLLESYTVQPLDWAKLQQQGVPEMLWSFACKSAEATYNAEQVQKSRELINMSNLLAENHNLDTVANAIRAKGLQLFNADVGWIYLRDFEKGKLHLAREAEKPAQGAPEWLEIGELIAGRAAQDEIVHRMDDTQSFSAVEPIPAEGILSQVAIPLRRAGLTIGVMVFGSRYAYAFSEKDVSLMRSFATLAGQALDQAKLRLHMDKINKSVLQTVEQLAEQIVIAARDLTGKSAAIWRLDESTNVLAVLASRGISDRFLRQASLHYTGQVDSLIAKSFSTGRTEIYKDLTDPEAPQSIQLLQSCLQEGWKSVMVVPLFDSESKPVGALTLHGRRVGEFSNQEVVSLENFASQAAAAIENARRRANLVRLVESGQITIQHVTDEPEVLNQFVKMVCELTGAPCAVIYPYDSERGEFFSVDKIAVHGLLWQKKEIHDKPRDKGLASIIRREGKFVVHDLDRGEMEPITLSANEQIDLPEMIQRGKFVEREKIKAFIGISLRATEMGKTSGTAEEMGVMYINYRAPHHFTSSEIALVQLFAQQAANLIRAARLYARQNEESRINQMLLAASEKLARAGKRSEVLKTAFDQAFMLVGKTTGLIVSVESDNTLKIIGRMGVSAQNVKDFNQKKNSARLGTFGYVASSGNLFESSDTDVERASGKIIDLGLPIPKQLTNLPVKYAGRVNAILVLDTVAPNDRARKALLALAEIAGTALEKVLADEERSQQLDALQKIIDALGKDKNPLMEILQQAVQLFNADRGNIVLAVEAARELFFDAHWERSQLFNPPSIPEDKRHQGFERGITGYVARERKSYRTGDAKNDLYYEPLYPETQSEMAVPLLDSRRKLIGILDLESNLPEAFSSNDLLLCERLARMAAIALEKSTLLRVTRLLQGEIQKLEKIHHSPNLLGAMEQIVQGVVEILGKDIGSCSINLYDEQDKRFLPTMVAAGSLSEELVRVPPRTEGGLGMYVMQTKKPVYYEDANHPPKKMPTVNVHLRKLGVRSFAALPLVRGRHRLGALFIHLRAPLTFSRDLRSVLELYAKQAAIVIDGAQGMWIGAAMQRMQDASVSQPPTKFFELVVREAAKLMQVEYGELWLKRPDGSLHLEAFYKPKHVAIPDARRTIQPGTPSTNWWVLEHKESKIVEQVEDVKDQLFEIYPQAKSTITVPLLYQNNAIGTITLESQQAKTFSQQDIPRLNRFAIPTAIAIHNANLSRQAETLQKVAQVLNAVSDRKQVIQLVFKHLREVIDFTNASVQTIRGDQRKLEASTGPTTRGELQRNVSKDRLVQEIVRDKKPRVIPDVAKEPLWEVFEETKNIRSWIGIPLVVNNRVIGLLTVDHDKPEMYTPETGRLAAAFADVVAAAIRRSQQDQALREINALSQQLLSYTDVNTLLKLIADKAFEVLQADIIQLYEYDQATDTFRPKPYAAGKYFVEFYPRQVTGHDDVVYSLILRKAPWYVKDALAEDLLKKPFTKERGALPEKRFVVREQIASNAILPLRSGTEAVGLLFVNYRSRQAFDADQRTLIELFASQAAIAILNARLFESQRRRNDELRLLNQAGQTVSSTLDLDRVLKTVLNQVSRLFNVFASSLWLLDPATGGLICHDATGPGKKSVVGWKLEPGEGIAGWVAQEGTPLIISDTREDPRHYKAVDQKIKVEIRSIVTVPLRSRDRVLGVLQVVDKQPGKFTQNHQDLLEPLAAFAAAAIENARLFSEKELQAKRLEFVNQLGKKLTEQIDISEAEALKLVHETAGKLMDVNNMFIALYDQANDEVSFGLAYVDKERIDTATRPGWGPRRHGNGMTEEVIHQKQPILIKTKAAAEEWYRIRDNSIKVTFVSWLGVPMLVGEKGEESVLGVIATYNQTLENIYDESHKEALELIGQQAAIALRNARMVQDIKRRNEELTQLTELGVTLGSFST